MVIGLLASYHQSSLTDLSGSRQPYQVGIQIRHRSRRAPVRLASSRRVLTSGGVLPVVTRTYDRDSLTGDHLSSVTQLYQIVQYIAVYISMS